MSAAPLRSGLYEGMVVHERRRPQRHSLAYRVVYGLFDLDELDTLDRRLRLFSRNRFNLFGLREADHLDGENPDPLRLRVDRLLRAAGAPAEGGRVRLLTMPRMLGHAFNPLSIFFCEDAAGRLHTLVYEVNNTFGQRHSYLLPVPPDQAGGVIRQHCAKRFYVSPFLQLDLTYRFRIRPPGDRVVIGVRADDGAGAVIATAFSGHRRVLSDGAILAAVARHPLLGAKVLAGIHWEALRLWSKGAQLQPRPAPPAEPVTFAPSSHPPSGPR